MTTTTLNGTGASDALLDQFLDYGNGRIATATAIVRGMADGTLTLTNDEIDEAIDRVMDRPEFVRRVRIVRDRIQLQTIADTKPEHAVACEELDAEKASATSKIERTRERLAAQRKAAETEFEETLAEIAGRRNAAAAKRQTAQDARQRLFDGCPHPEVVGHLADLRAERDAVLSNLAGIRATLPAEIAKWKNAQARTSPTITEAEATIAEKPQFGNRRPGTFEYQKIETDNRRERERATRVLESATRTARNAQSQIDHYSAELAEAEATLPARIADLDQRIAAAEAACVEP